MTDNKRVTNKQILDKIDALKVGDEGLNILAIKIVSRMVKLKSMEDWFTHVSRSDIAWATAYKDLELTEVEHDLIALNCNNHGFHYTIISKDDLIVPPRRPKKPN